MPPSFPVMQTKSCPVGKAFMINIHQYNHRPSVTIMHILSAWPFTDVQVCMLHPTFQVFLDVFASIISI